MDIYKLDKDYRATTQRPPAFLNPFPRDKSIHYEMKMGDAALVEFQNGNVLHHYPELATQIETKLIEYSAEIPGGIAFDLRGVEC